MTDVFLIRGVCPGKIEMAGDSGNANFSDPAPVCAVPSPRYVAVIVPAVQSPNAIVFAGDTALPVTTNSADVLATGTRAYPV